MSINYSYQKYIQSTIHIRVVLFAFYKTILIMKLTINTDVLQREHLSLGEFLVLLLGYYNLKYKECYNTLIRDGTIQANLFDKNEIILSDNTKNLIAKILMESDEKVINSSIDFNSLALKLQALYPKGNKSGTSYSWRDNTGVIAQKLRTLVALHNFSFTEEEALRATKEYVDSFEDKEKMQLLKYFILKTTHDGQVTSLFMTTIENNR